MREALVVALRFVVGRLVLLAEVAAARLLARQGIEREQFRELEVVGHAAGVLEILVRVVRVARHRHVVPELFANLRNLRERALQAPGRTRHAHVVPHHATELAVQFTRRLAALDRQQPRDLALRVVRGLAERLVLGGDLRQRRARQIVAERVGDDEVAVGQALHQRARAEAVGAVVGEVRFTEHVQARDRRHEVVVHPQSTHRVVHGGVDPHRHVVRVVVGDLLVHVEQVAVPLADHALPEPVDGIAEVEVHRQPRLTHAAPVVAHQLGGARRDVARDEIAEARIAAFEVVVALAFGNLLRRTPVARVLRHPHAPVVAQALAHERELALVIAAHGDARWVDLREARVGEQRAALVRAPRRGDVAVHRVGREVVRGAVAARAEQHGVAGPLLDLARLQVARDDAARLSVDHDDVEHLAMGHERDGARVHLPHHRLVRTDEELLARLSARVERARHLRAAERPVVEQTAVLARERHALRHALIDDVDADLREPVDVGLARAIVAALHRVVEEAVDAVAVVPVVLRGVDAALRGDRVRTARAVVDAEGEDVVAELTERGGGRCAGQARTHADDRQLATVGRVHQLRVELVPIPFPFDGTARDLAVERHHCATW